MITTSTVPVVIVGAGPAGLVTAVSLAHQGVASLIIERHPSTSIFPRATGVSLRSMEIFRGWGIDDAIRRGGWRVIPRQATVRTLSDRHPVESPLGFPDEAASLAVSPTTAAVSPQDHLEPVLVEHVRSLGLGEVRFSTELVAFQQDADGVDVVVRDRVSGAESVVRTSYLIGADGHRSTIRTSLGIPMEGPADLGRFVSILFRADMAPIIGERPYGLYLLEGDGPPRVFVPSGADDRFVLAIPVPPGMDDAATDAAFPLDRCVALVREAAGDPDLEVEILATGSFAFSAQVAARSREGRVFLVGDANHRMTPRGGRGMNTAIHDANDLGWKLAWAIRGLAGPALLDTHATERGPVGRRNVAMSMVPGGGGSDDGLSEDLGPLAAMPGARAPHLWLGEGETRRSTLDLVGPGLVLLTAGEGAAWANAVSVLQADLPIAVHAIEQTSFATAFGLGQGGAVLVRPDGIIAWRCEMLPARPGKALAAAVAKVLAWPASVEDNAGTGAAPVPAGPSARRPLERRLVAAASASLGMLTLAWWPGFVAASASRVHRDVPVIDVFRTNEHEHSSVRAEIAEEPAPPVVVGSGLASQGNTRGRGEADPGLRATRKGALEPKDQPAGRATTKREPA